MANSDERTSRLNPIQRDQELLPLRRAKDVVYCRLYWIPVRSFPLSEGQRAWLLEFMNRLFAMYEKEVGVRVETFLDVKPTINGPLTETLAEHREELVQHLGWRRAPKAHIPDAPSEKEIEDLREGRKKFDYDDFMADYAFWFMLKEGAKQREWLFGHGALTTLLIPPAEKDEERLVMPKMKAFEEPEFKAPGTMQQVLEIGESLEDGFLEKSKELFAADYADHYQVRDFGFVIPRLASKDFFSQPEEEQDKWFELFDAYVAESPEDKGVLIATAIDAEEEMAEILEAMKSEGFTYPEV